MLFLGFSLILVTLRNAKEILYFISLFYFFGSARNDLVVLYGIGTIGFEVSHHSVSGENSDENINDKKESSSVLNKICLFILLLIYLK